ncbi:indolepyruvate ferredoxin oxidoreductase family protein [Paracoccus litorisediminis]|uniref:Indolepyruvate ferredoxin oxidoreductase family protein n=1 Tax=Paracoccus litorisediminis TaxID=2006130 RepID=A0A844HL52_9RHOB|nr:indolepyruvate ferredoxin oxidoreductase family protein [Paracoccus litorisediminis]MTH60983.1 indolepyruvate ferredoxin oxidoreductase family protein [Paracoccus litorisediminis]
MFDQPADKRLDFDLSDRLTKTEGWVYMTGMQALVRLPLQQRKRDMAAGLKTGGYISGYRGSPLGRYDMELWQAHAELKAHDIVFQPGLNEDLAATAAWGSQMVGLFPGAEVEGVFSIWYGKTPGLDRAMDPIRHANLAGTNPKGGSLLLVGDDHGAKSSSVACYSDFNFVSAGIPLLAPANAQEVLDYGLHGIALSRFAGCLAGMKLVTDVVEGGGSVRISADEPRITLPEAPPVPGIAVFATVLQQERQLYDARLARALDYIRANGLNLIIGAGAARIGIVAAGKAWQDLSQALNEMGWSEGRLAGMGLRLLKVGAVWPLDDRIVRDFAEGLDTIVVVEEKRPLLEDQIRATLYGQARAPRIIGKTFAGQAYASDAGEVAFQNYGEIDPNQIRGVLTRAIRDLDPAAPISAPNAASGTVLLDTPGALRMPSFCAGCPHGRSTRVPDGSRALAGIGCHTMAVLRDPMKTNSITQMGGEGVAWLGQFHFTKEKHVFANMGDGTYFHSGLLAIRAAIAAKVNITYKLLHNGFVSMTGGQPVDGEIDPLRMIDQLRAEGVAAIALVADEPQKYQGTALPANVTLHPRTEMDLVQRQMRERTGVTAIIYDQPCATERRRLRKRGKWVDPDKRAFINPEVCEGCGDCSTVSGCMAIEPIETELGRKRQINQSSCNKDFSCVEGFCPSFVTVAGVKPKRVKAAHVNIDAGALPQPVLPAVAGSWAVLVSGIGGAGVVTVGQTLAVAAHADGWFSSNLDITSLSQKYGAVHSHIKMARTPEDMAATRIATGEADALIGCDLVVAAGDETLSKLNLGHALAVTDTTVVPTSEFAKNPDWQLNGGEQLSRLTRLLGDRAQGLDAQGLATRLLGDAVYANMLLVGASWQSGALPLSLEAMMRAIELNGVKIAENRRAFDLGRLAVADPQAVAALLRGAQAPVDLGGRRKQSLDDVIAHRAGELTAYKNAALARRYTDMVARTRKAADAAGLGEAPVMAVARCYYKLLAVKDEWEVARLYSKPEFAKSLAESFDGQPELTFYFGAWPYGGRDEKTGAWVKGAVSGRKALRLFGLMRRLGWLRGTLLDPFRNSEEARLARRLLAEYEADIAFALARFGTAAGSDLTALLSLPEHIRGYGHVRERHAADVDTRRAKLRAALTTTTAAAA